MRTGNFDYELPPELIAQSPAGIRDRSRLLTVDRASGKFSHARFTDLLACLRRGDVLVLNNSRVIPARLRGTKADTGGAIELLLLCENAVNDWWVLLRPGKRVRAGTQLALHHRGGAPCGVRGTVLEKNSEGHCRILFSDTANILHEIDRIGEIPLPPYIDRRSSELEGRDRERYQTIYAAIPGSVAAPTAGLHFSESLLSGIRELGVQIHPVTLHVGLATFAPVKTEQINRHKMHEEYFEVSPSAAQAVSEAQEQGRRIWAVGTTTVRVLESIAAAHQGRIVPTRGRTRIFIYPPFSFRVVTGLITNFHLPRSTLLMLVSAFAAPGKLSGRDLILAAYAEAIRERYRFFSYGDAMLLI